MSTRRDGKQPMSALYDKLVQLRSPSDLSFNAWAAKAGVSGSFFTNLRNGHDPGVDTLRRVLAAAGATMGTFFAHDPDAESRPEEQSIDHVDLHGLDASARLAILTLVDKLRGRAG